MKRVDMLTLVGKSLGEKGDVGSKEGGVDESESRPHLHVAATVVPEVCLDELQAALDSVGD